MATSKQLSKAVVRDGKGNIVRAKTAEVILATFGPMSDKDLTVNMQRVDEGATLRNVQWALYQLRDAKLAKKSDEGVWAVLPVK